MASFFNQVGNSIGTGGLQIRINLTGTPETNPQDIFYLRHRPSWKVRKNVFSALKSHTLSNNQQQQIVPGTIPHGRVNNPNEGRIMAYSCDYDTQGEVTLAMGHGKKLDHMGIQVKFFGRIDMEAGAHEGRPSYDFISLSKELLPPGSLFDTRTIPFNFRGVEKIHETYHGRNVSVKYFVRVEVQRQLGGMKMPPITQEHEVIVQIPGVEPSINEPIKMEVGIEDCLHIEFEYEKRCYHLHDVICGKINFLLVRIKIKHMELAVIRRETSGEGVATSAALSSAGGGGGSSAKSDTQNVVTETQTLLKYEIMDGAPVKGELIPVRLHLRGIPADVTPTYHAENNRFAVRYFLNLVLVDEEDRRYFKQQEIILWRKELG